MVMAPFSFERTNTLRKRICLSPGAFFISSYTVSVCAGSHFFKYCDVTAFGLPSSTTLP